VFTQYVDHCGAHQGCTVITCVTDEAVADPEAGAVLYPSGATVWESHLGEGVHAEHRINPGYPAFDRRQGDVPVAYTAPCPACAALFSG